MGGCYTMLFHPSVRTADETTGTEQTFSVNHTERCTDCHTGTVHGSLSGMQGRGMRSLGGLYDYDPFRGYDNYGYYDPWFMGSSSYSPYFYDSYYSYRNIPWWLYYVPTDDSGGGESSGESAPALKEKPVRRGGAGGEDLRGYSPPPAASKPASGGAEKPSASPPPSQGQGGSSSGNDDQGKEKPARRGEIK
jgi:hypothetical protein